MPDAPAWGKADDTWGGGEKQKNETNQWVRCSERLRGLLNPNKSHSQPTRCSAAAVINILSLLLRPPPMFVHSSPGKVSTMPIKPRQRPTIRSPWTTWMCADDRGTDLNHAFCLLDISVTDWQNQRFIFQCAHISLPTAPWSWHSSPQTVCCHSSLSTGQTSTKVLPL